MEMIGLKCNSVMNQVCSLVKEMMLELLLGKNQRK